MLSRIVVIRHAKPFSEGYADETLRPISQEGRIIQLSIAEHLKKLNIIPTQIISSPLIRAEQTARVLSEVFDDTPIVINNALSYEFDENALLSLIPPPSENKTIFFIGHAPTLPDFVNKLVGEDVLLHGLKTSGAVVIDFRKEVAFGKGHFAGYYHS